MRRLRFFVICKKKSTLKIRMLYAQMERFELSHRLSQSTPLAGEPLEPLGYICRGFASFRAIELSTFG